MVGSTIARHCSMPCSDRGDGPRGVTGAGAPPPRWLPLLAACAASAAAAPSRDPLARARRLYNLAAIRPGDRRRARRRDDARPPLSPAAADHGPRRPRALSQELGRPRSRRRARAICARLDPGALDAARARRIAGRARRVAVLRGSLRCRGRAVRLGARQSSARWRRRARARARLVGDRARSRSAGAAAASARPRYRAHHRADGSRSCAATRRRAPAGYWLAAAARGAGRSRSRVGGRDRPAGCARRSRRDRGVALRADLDRLVTAGDHPGTRRQGRRAIAVRPRPSRLGDVRRVACDVRQGRWPEALRSICA